MKCYVNRDALSASITLDADELSEIVLALAAKLRHCEGVSPTLVQVHARLSNAAAHMICTPLGEQRIPGHGSQGKSGHTSDKPDK